MRKRDVVTVALVGILFGVGVFALRWGGLIRVKTPPTPLAPSASAQPPPVPSTAPSAIPPKVSFDYLIGESGTHFKMEGEHANRGSNIRRVVDILMNEQPVILKPQEEWSFNDAVGPRTKDKGFLEAPVISMGEMVPGVGGGTCQASSTIHAAAVNSGLDITYRRPHSRPAAYIKTGLDATVSYPPACKGKHRENAWNKKNKACTALDLRFKNPFDFSVMIKLAILDVQKQPWLSVTVYGTKRSPIEEIRTFWTEYSSPPFKKRMRVTNKWRNDHRELIQKGRAGTNGALIIRTETNIGDTKSRRVVSEYKPQDEIWEVGLGWDRERKPWEPEGVVDAGAAN